MIRRAFFATLLLTASCASRPEGNATAEPVAVPPPVPGSAAPASSATASPAPADDEGELRPGRRTFHGMVRPTKGGYEIRSVLLEDAALPDALAKSAMDGIPKDPQWFLGAVVRVTAEIVAHDSPPPRSDGLAEQRREGSWLSSSTIEVAELLERAQQIEGTVTRSKGLFQVGQHLVRREDLAWSLASSGGGKEGDRVRLWGQPRTVHCAPNAQCLEGGSIPMFDVGRAEKTP